MATATIRRAITGGYFRALAAARVDRIVMGLRHRRGEVVALNLHRVSPRPNPYWPPLTPEAFESLAAHLARSCTVLTFAELHRQPRGDRPRVVLSFDDGCRDFIEYAMPILDRYDLAANHNVIVQCVETGRPPWVISLMDALVAAGDAQVRALQIPGFARSLSDCSDGSKALFGARLANYLKDKSPGDRGHVWPGLSEFCAQAASTAMMSRADLVAIGDVHELGGHSYSHESMGRLSAEEFRREIAQCEAFFASIDKPMDVFAFPNGSFRADQIDYLHSRGVRHVLLVDERVSRRVAGAHPRITIYGESHAELRVRAAGLAPATVLQRADG